MKLDVALLEPPNFVTLKMPVRPRQEGFKEAPSLHVREVDAETLSTLADIWREKLFEKAGKPDPRKAP